MTRKNKDHEWKYSDDAWDESMEEEYAPESLERQCTACQRWIDRELTYCVWCGRPQREKN